MLLAFVGHEEQCPVCAVLHSPDLVLGVVGITVRSPEEDYNRDTVGSSEARQTGGASVATYYRLGRFGGRPKTTDRRLLCYIAATFWTVLRAVPPSRTSEDDRDLGRAKRNWSVGSVKQPAVTDMKPVTILFRVTPYLRKVSLSLYPTDRHPSRTIYMSTRRIVDIYIVRSLAYSKPH